MKSCGDFSVMKTKKNVEELTTWIPKQLVKGIGICYPMIYR